MKTILVPTDFSRAAGNAAEYALNLAKEIKAKVLLFHAYHLPIQISDYPVMDISAADLQRENDILLQKEAERLKKKTGVQADCLARIGFAVDEILEEEKNASFLVMGMKGVSQLDEVLMGSITTATLKKSLKPILVIPEQVQYKDPENIVFACDYHPDTDSRTLDAISCFFKPFASHIHIVNIGKKQDLHEVQNNVMANVERKLNEVEHSYHFLESDDLQEAIDQFVMKYRADMVIVIPHRYHVLDRLFHRSASRKMAFHSQVPLLALPDNHKSGAAYFM